MLQEQPGFAEIHFRLGQLLEAAGKPAEADRHYIRARDLDGLPMRCPTPLLSVYRRTAEQHLELLFSDGPATLRTASADGLVGDSWIQDGQHPTFRAYVALAQALLDRIAQENALGWPAGMPAPRIDLDECAATSRSPPRSGPRVPAAPPASTSAPPPSDSTLPKAWTRPSS
ncbi:MAG: hypothetical protein U0800_10065 [Isosphaeraceae bacterium]